MHTAQSLNDHLTSGGVVQITTYGKSTLYNSKHTGWFTVGADGNVYVQRGRSKDCLTMAAGTKWLVGVRTGRLVAGSSKTKTEVTL